MAVVTKYSTAYPEGVGKLPKPNFVQATVYSASALVTVANGDSANSVFNIVRLPSNARVLQPATLRHGAIAGLALSVGFPVNNKAAALISAYATAGAGSMTLTQQLTLADMQKPLWQLAGYANDPGGLLDVVATVTTAATAGGDLLFDFLYAV